MIDPRVLEFIRNQLKAGYTQEEISQALLNSGWSQKDVDVAFSVLRYEDYKKLEKIVDEETPKEKALPEKGVNEPEKQMPKDSYYSPPPEIGTSISKVGISSLATIFFFIFLIFGVIITVIGIVVSLISPKHPFSNASIIILKSIGLVSLAEMGMVSHVLSVIIIGFVGLVLGILIAVFFNLVAGRIGGLDVQT